MRSYEFKRYLSSLKDTRQKEIYFYRLKYIFARKIDSFLKVQKGAQVAIKRVSFTRHIWTYRVEKRKEKKKKRRSGIR